MTSAIRLSAEPLCPRRAGSPPAAGLHLHVVGEPPDVARAPDAHDADAALGPPEVAHQPPDAVAGVAVEVAPHQQPGCRLRRPLREPGRTEQRRRQRDEVRVADPGGHVSYAVCGTLGVSFTQKSSTTPNR